MRIYIYITLLIIISTSCSEKREEQRPSGLIWYTNNEEKFIDSLKFCLRKGTEDEKRTAALNAGFRCTIEKEESLISKKSYFKALEVLTKYYRDEAEYGLKSTYRLSIAHLLMGIKERGLSEKETERMKVLEKGISKIDNSTTITIKISDHINEIINKNKK